MAFEQGISFFCFGFLESMLVQFLRLYHSRVQVAIPSVDTGIKASAVETGRPLSLRRFAGLECSRSPSAIQVSMGESEC